MANAPVNNSVYDHDKTSRRFRCDVCEDKWPESRLVMQDGAFVCMDNCWYPGGSKVDRALRRAEAASIAATSTAKHAVPPVYPGTGLMVGQPGVESISPYPANLTTGGSAVTILVTGVNFSSANTTITYSDLGFTNSPAPVYTPTLITLSVLAEPGEVASGLYDMTINGQIYRGVFKVKQ